MGLRDVYACAQALNKLYKESVPLTAHLSKDELDIKVLEIKGQLEATVDNPQLLKRWVLLSAVVSNGWSGWQGQS